MAVERGFLRRLPGRLGVDGSPPDPRLVWGILGGILLLYTLSFALFYPRSHTNEDETRYILQSRLLLEGHAVLQKIDPLSGEAVDYIPSDYPAGTAFLMAPFVWLAGWRGAFAGACASLLAGVLLTAAWLRDEGRSPVFALLLLGYPAALVAGRVPLSDLPSMALVAAGLLCFFRGIAGPSRWWFLSGLVAGSSLAVRMTNAVPFAPFYLGSVLRREPAWPVLASGGVVGVGLSMLANHVYFGDPLFLRHGYLFDPWTTGERLPLFLFGLLVLVPGGLLFGLAYRGRRRPELVVAVALFFFLYATQPYSIAASSLPKRLVVALRYFLPLLPLLAFAAAEAAPRLGRRIAAALPAPTRARAATLLGLSLVAWTGGVAAAGVAVHPVLSTWASAQAEIQREIAERTGDESILVTNFYATRKHLRLIERRYLPVQRSQVTAGDVADLARRYGEVFVIFLDRSDSAYWRGDADANTAFLETLGAWPELELDRRITATDRLRIWRIRREAVAR